MGEQDALRQVSPLIAKSFEALHAHMCRLEKRVKALETKQSKQPLTIEGHVSREEVRKMIRLANKKYEAE